MRLFRSAIRAFADASPLLGQQDARMPSRKLRVVIAGGGVAALEAMVALRALAEERVSIELLAPDRDFFYRPLSVAEPFGAGEVERFDLEGLALGCDARHTLGSLVAVYPDEHRIRTSRGAFFEYDRLLIAIGARTRKALAGALTFRDQTDAGMMRALLEDLERGDVKHVVFALPGGVTWPLPLYELALLTASHAAELAAEDVRLTVVTPEDAPLALLGREASEAVRTLLAERGISLLTGTYPDAFEDGRLRVVPGEPVEADRVVSLPRLSGIPLAGVLQDDDSFIPTDGHGRVVGLADVYAAGDLTTFPVKQGGLAAQQADAVAEAIAAEAGVLVEPRPFDPVLRGLLLTGSVGLYLRTELGGGRGETSVAHGEALWWPRAKIAARYLGPYLAEHAGLGYRTAKPAEGSFFEERMRTRARVSAESRRSRRGFPDGTGSPWK
jgi:sulfide:quinone oxidoreductase